LVNDYNLKDLHVHSSLTVYAILVINMSTLVDGFQRGSNRHPAVCKRMLGGNS